MALTVAIGRRESESGLGLKMETAVKSRIESGFIVPPSNLELIATDHCNLTCRGCNHASPAVGNWSADPQTVRRDFSILAKYYRPRKVKVLGGEPLLHPKLAEVIWAARSTGISDYFLLVTNGVLLKQMDNAVMEAIDELEISLYPEVERREEILAVAQRKSLQFGTLLTVNEYDNFRAGIATLGTDNVELVRKIYQTCKIANLWGCHGVRDGYFYKCPQSIYIPRLVQGIKGVEADRLRIEDTDDFQTRLLTFLNSRDPLRCCTYCVGTAGKLEPHALIRRAQWRLEMEKPSSELIDYDWLERSLIKQDEYDDCKIETRVGSSTVLEASTWTRLPAPQRQTVAGALQEMAMQDKLQSH